MKNFLLACLAGCIPALVVTNGANAQDSINIAMLEPPKNAIKMDKAIMPERANTTSMGTVNTKAVKDFRKSYKSAVDEQWSKNADGLSAGFTLNGIKNTIFYNKKGSWAGSLKGYTEDKLARNIREIVKREYYDYKITYVQEVEIPSSRGEATYIVHLEDENTIKQVRISDNQMEVYREYSKR